MPDDDPIEDLRARLRATQEAAERLAAAPSGGWESLHEARGGFEQEARALAALAATVRDLLPPDLREQLEDLVRRLLLLVRAVLDLLIARLEAGGPGPPDEAGPAVEDIPVS